MNVIAIIPIKYNSSRVPGKNFKLMNGKPLFYYIINTLLKCKNIKHIIINLDNNYTKTQINKYFDTNKLIYYNRPKHLIGDDVSTNELIKDTILNIDVNTDFYLQTHVTNPLLSSQTVVNAIYKYSNIKNEYDSLFSVKSWYTRLYDESSKAINHDPEHLIPTQNLKPIYEENSCIYIFTKQNFLKTNKRIGNKPFLFKMSNYESQDIDWNDDFRVTEMIMKNQLNKNKVVLITGINGDIGDFLGYYFKSKDWMVIGLDITEKENSNCDLFYKCDISNEKEIEYVVTDLGYYEKIDLIVNNAAYQLCKKWIDCTAKEWEQVINSNLRSVFLLSKYLYPKLKKAKGSIVNISSVHATHTSKNIGIYATSKGGLTTLTRSMAIEFGEDNIRVNAILPGAIDTKMLREGLERGHLGNHSKENLFKILENKHILGRIGKPSDIAEMVYFLSNNEKAGYITGQCFYVDGGSTIKLSTEN